MPDVLAPPEWVCREYDNESGNAKIHEAQLRKGLPEFRPGDTVRVNVRLKEGEGDKEKERLQAFEGVVISKKGRASGATFTVRRVSFGVGIERIFPLHSPSISSIEVVGEGKCGARGCITCAICGVKRRASSARRVKRLRRVARRLLRRLKLRRSSSLFAGTRETVQQQSPQSSRREQIAKCKLTPSARAHTITLGKSHSIYRPSMKIKTACALILFSFPVTVAAQTADEVFYQGAGCT